MRTWRRGPLDINCGCCGKAIAAGQPYLELQTPRTGRRRFVRCCGCAGEPVPADVPAAPIADRTAMKPLMNFPTGVGTLPLDFKTRGAEPREPGEEG